jgi:hypothetical protein
MALQTVWTETTAVLIFVARNTCSRNSEESLVQVFVLDGTSLVRWDTVGSVATTTGEPCMFAEKFVAGRFMVESSRIPFDQREVDTIVFRVAAGTFRTRCGVNMISRMKTAMRCNSGGNLGMTVQAFEHRLTTAHFVTGSALRGTIQRLVSSREPPRRDLGVQSRKRHHNKCSGGDGPFDGHREPECTRRAISCDSHAIDTR